MYQTIILWLVQKRLCHLELDYRVTSNYLHITASVAEIVLLCIITTLVTQRLLSFAVSWSNIKNLGHALLTTSVHISTLKYSNALKYSLDDIAHRYGIVLNHWYCIKSWNHKRYERWRIYLLVCLSVKSMNCEIKQASKQVVK